MRRRGHQRPTPPWLLLNSRSIHDGEHLPKVLRAAAQGALGTRTYIIRPRRYDLRLPPTSTKAARSSTSTSAFSNVFGNDELGKLATALF
jgi:hypothetical protein